jgi:hypothetical protein
MRENENAVDGGLPQTIRHSCCDDSKIEERLQKTAQPRHAWRSAKWRVMPRAVNAKAGELMYGSYIRSLSSVGFADRFAGFRRIRERQTKM